MKVVLVCLIRGEAGRYQKSVIDELARLSGERYLLDHSLPQHVTLRSPFDVADLKKLEQVVEEFANLQKKTPLTIKGFGNFGERVAFLNTYFSKQAHRIQSQLVSLVRDTFGISPGAFDSEWKPHATVAYGNTPDTFKIIWNSLKGKHPVYELEFDNITILTKPRDLWEIHRVYELA